MHYFIWLCTSQIVTCICVVLWTLTLYKSGLFILTLLYLYALFHPTVYKSDCHIYMSCIMGPYFVQVGAFHSNPIIFICIISSDFVQVVAFILILLECHIHKLFFTKYFSTYFICHIPFSCQWHVFWVLTLYKSGLSSLNLIIILHFTIFYS